MDKLFHAFVALTFIFSPGFSHYSYGQTPPEPRRPGDQPPEPTLPATPKHKSRPNPLPFPPEPHQPSDPYPPEPHHPTPPQPHIPGPPEPHHPPAPYPPEPHYPPAPYPPEPHIPEPTLPSADLYRVRQVAGEQANMMANRVVGIYGEAERILYSFQLGLIEGVNSVMAAGSVDHSPDYQRGLSRGVSEGRSVGDNAGNRQGTSDGNSEGYRSGGSRFEAVVDKNVNPDTTFQTPQIPARNFVVDRPAVKSLEERLNEKNAEFYALMNRHTYMYEGYYARDVFAGNVVTLGQLYSMGGSFNFNVFVDSYARSQWAWDAWRNRQLGGNYSNALDYYRTISDPRQTSNADEARRVFEREFKSQYDMVIGAKWRSYVRRLDPLARSEGVTLGRDVAYGYVSDLGFDAGYRQEYPAAARQSYGQTYATAYFTGFNSATNYYQTHAVPAQLNAVMQPENGVYLPLSAVNVVIQNVADAGRVDGDVAVSLNGDGIYSVKKGSLSLKAGRSLAAPVTFAALGQVNGSVVPDQDNNVQIIVGGEASVVTFRVFWPDVITALGKTGNNLSAQNIYSTYIQKQLSLDWQGGMKKDLLNKLVQVYRSLNGVERATVASQRERFRSVYGAQPGIFNPAKRKEWNNAQALLNQLR